MPERMEVREGKSGSVAIVLSEGSTSGCIGRQELLGPWGGDNEARGKVISGFGEG